MLFQRKLLINESDDSEMEKNHANDDKHHEIKMKLLSNEPTKTKEALEEMELILSRYRNDNGDLDKLDITLLKGIYKHDPNAIAESEVSFEASSSSEFSESKSDSDFSREEVVLHDNGNKLLPILHF